MQAILNVHAGRRSPTLALKFSCAHDHPHYKKAVQLFVTKIFCIRPLSKNGLTCVRYNDTMKFR